MLSVLWLSVWASMQSNLRTAKMSVSTDWLGKHYILQLQKINIDTNVMSDWLDWKHNSSSVWADCMNMIVSIKLHQVRWFYLFSAKSSSHSPNTSSATQGKSLWGISRSLLFYISQHPISVWWGKPVVLERSMSLSSGHMIWSLLHHNHTD